MTARESVRREPGRGGAPHSPPEAPVRKRRSSHEVEELILGTARELFAARGYAGVTTRDLAIEAGVNETSIYRRFGSKAGLFDAAVLEPYHKFMTTFMEAWKEDVRAPKSQRDIVRSFVIGLYDTLSENRDVILAYIYVHRFVGFESQADAANSVISRELEIMDEWVAEASGAFGFKHLDDPVTLHCSFALLMGIVLHQDLIFPPGPRRPSRERIIRELTTYVYHAIATR